MTSPRGEYFSMALAKPFGVVAASMGGDVPTDTTLSKGAFYAPTVIEGLTSEARVCQEESFGPVIVALPFEDEADAITQGNGTAFGLAAGIWTGDYARAWRLARALEAGSVWINTYKQSHIATPFGGFKDSGIGREKGLYGLRLYSQVKSVFWGLRSAEFAEFPIASPKYSRALRDSVDPLAAPRTDRPTRYAQLRATPP